MESGVRLNVRRLRREAGMTQQELAGAAGIELCTLSKIECAHNMPSLRTAVSLAEALGCTLDELVSREDKTAERLRTMREAEERNREREEKWRRDHERG